MISDFIILDDFNITDKVSCHCFLPDPDLDNENDIINCGNIEYDEDTSKLSIELFDNFKELCIGDIYQRKEFIVSVIYNLKMNGIEIITTDLDFYVSDPWGKYTDVFPPTDTQVWE